MIVGESQQYFYWTYSCLALGLSLVASVLPAYLVSRRELHEEAAQLLLPKPPVKGSKILLERITFIWSRLSFTQKVTARNIFRYKQRMLMTIFGGCRFSSPSLCRTLVFNPLWLEWQTGSLRTYNNTRWFSLYNSSASNSDKAKHRRKIDRVMT